MKLSIFARGLTGRPTGRGFLAREMIAALQRAAPDLSIQLFAGDSFDGPGVESLPARGLWRTLRGIGRDVRRTDPGVFWSATHFLPGNLPKALPKVVTLLDLVWRDHPETMSRLRRWGSGWLESGLHRADRIVCISGFTRDRLIAHWPELGPWASVMHLGPNARLKMPSSKLPAHLGIDRPYLLNVDTVEPRKGLPVLIEAMKKLPDLLLVQCGGIGWNVDETLRQARSVPNVRLMGYVPEEDLAVLYRGAVAAVFPSIYEGFHLPPLDAASLGCPIILSDIPVHQEVFQGGAVYFPPNDVEALLARIRSLDRAALSKAGLQIADRYSWDKSAAVLLDVFRSVAR